MITLAVWNDQSCLPLYRYRHRSCSTFRSPSHQFQIRATEHSSVKRHLLTRPYTRFCDPSPSARTATLAEMSVPFDQAVDQLAAMFPSYDRAVLTEVPLPYL